MWTGGTSIHVIGLANALVAAPAERLGRIVHTGDPRRMWRLGDPALAQRSCRSLLTPATPPGSSARLRCASKHGVGDHVEVRDLAEYEVVAG